MNRFCYTINITHGLNLEILSYNFKRCSNASCVPIMILKDILPEQPYPCNQWSYL